MAEPQSTQQHTRRWVLLIGLAATVLALLLVVFELFGLLQQN